MTDEDRLFAWRYGSYRLSGHRPEVIEGRPICVATRDGYFCGRRAVFVRGFWKHYPRPATDSARLDVERRALVEDAVKTAASIGLHFPALCHAFGIDDTVGPAIDLARLSVADRPGPS